MTEHKAKHLYTLLAKDLKGFRYIEPGEKVVINKNRPIYIVYDESGSPVSLVVDDDIHNWFEPTHVEFNDKLDELLE